MSCLRLVFVSCHSLYILRKTVNSLEKEDSLFQSFSFLRIELAEEMEGNVSQFCTDSVSPSLHLHFPSF